MIYLHLSHISVIPSHLNNWIFKSLSVRTTDIFSVEITFHSVKSSYHSWRDEIITSEGTAYIRQNMHLSVWHKYGVPLCRPSAQWLHINDSPAHHSPTRRQLGQSGCNATQTAGSHTGPCWYYHQLFHTSGTRLGSHTSGRVHRLVLCFHLLNETPVMLPPLGQHCGSTLWSEAGCKL